MSNFTVESVSICDFVSSDASGKAILIGVYQGNIRFSESPPAWPPLFFSIVLRPKTPKFDFSIKFVRPDGVNFVDLEGIYTAPGKPPAESRTIINFQIPPARFTGAGDYEIIICGADNAELYRETIPIAIGPNIKFVATINASIKVNAEL